jgi:hypothetical protein
MSNSVIPQDPSFRTLHKLSGAGGTFATITNEIQVREAAPRLRLVGAFPPRKHTTVAFTPYERSSAGISPSRLVPTQTAAGTRAGTTMTGCPGPGRQKAARPGRHRSAAPAGAAGLSASVPPLPRCVAGALPAAGHRGLCWGLHRRRRRMVMADAAACQPDRD